MAEKNPLLRKTSIAPQVKNLVWVCAWCSKEKYPVLLRGVEYTHGICRRHYQELSRGKDFSLWLIINEAYQRGMYHLQRRKKSISRSFHVLYRWPALFLKTASKLSIFSLFQIIVNKSSQLPTI